MKNTQNIPRTALNFLHTLATSPLIKQIILFGSRAIGDDRKRTHGRKK